MAPPHPHGLAIDPPSQATAVGDKYGGNILYVFKCSGSQHNEVTEDAWLKGGADVAWISQFPDEEEVLLPRYTELWAVAPARRFEGWSNDMKQKAAEKEVYEFEATYNYHYKFPCPNLRGLNKGLTLM